MLLIFLFLLASCTGTKHLPEGEKLYTGAEIKVVTADKVDRKNIEAVAEEAVRPLPNKSYFGMRPQLWMYMKAGEQPRSKLQKWLKKNGEAPVLLSQVRAGATASVIDARLFNMGIFKGYTESEIIEKKRTAKIVYTTYVHKPYVIKELTYDFAHDSIRELIMAVKDHTIIRPGRNYNLEALRDERIRVDAFLKNTGYFFFSPDYLLFKADTSVVDRTVSLQLTLKNDIPPEALRVYRIHNVTLNQNYVLNEEATDTAQLVFPFRDAYFTGTKPQQNIRPGVLLRSVYLKKGDVYSREHHNITLNRLMSIGNFKFVQVKFSESDTTAAGYLDVEILMTPMPNYTFRAEVDVVTKSNNYTGPRMNLSILNRNAFRGSELLSFNMAGSFEAQLNALEENLFSYSWNPQLEVTFPRFLIPFVTLRTRSIYVPKTKLTLSYNYMRRVNYFDMNTFQFLYGFRWKRVLLSEHEFNPVSVSYTSLSNETPEFLQLQKRNPFLRKSYEEQFVAGTSYIYTYNEQVLPRKKIQYYFQGTAETAGNLFALTKILGGNTPSPDNPTRILGSVYSQFAKFSGDGRLYYNFRSKNKLALRLFAGVAQPYGNSSTMPYSRQFFSGGPNSIRAFPINSLGPGTFAQSMDTIGFLQLGGEVKLEANAEYRFNIYRFFKGALFVDAGNVWANKSNPTGIGTPFLFSTFMNELAVGTGFGLRIDVSFFILRFDLAIPLRKPWIDNGNPWVINQIDFGSADWRRENLMLNIAIGYPF